jgi:5-methylcytosine-specific restriction endonuclease McrA
MSKKKPEFTIREKELAEALKITPERLDEIIAFFDSDPNDEWYLRENDHFIYLNQSWKNRLFSEHGAFAIAKYMDTIEETSKIIARRKQLIRDKLIQQKVHDNSTSLTIRNNRQFLSKKNIVKILCTSTSRLNTAFRDIQKSDNPMVIYEDFDDIEGARYYSLSGLEKLSKELATKLKDKDRREWCAAAEVLNSNNDLKKIISYEERKEQEINWAKKVAKERDRYSCQITGQKQTQHNTFNLAIHHIFSQEHYPHLATSMDNMITLAEDVHKEFHNWNGGNKAACTIDDLIRFVNVLYPEQEEASYNLNKIKKKLGAQKTT